MSSAEVVCSLRPLSRLAFLTLSELPLWSEMCLVQPAIHAMGDGYDVYVVTDASGGVSAEAL